MFQTYDVLSTRPSQSGNRLTPETLDQSAGSVANGRQGGPPRHFECVHYGGTPIEVVIICVQAW